MNVWQSKDQQVKKEVIKRGIFTKKPTEKTVCEVYIEDVSITITPDYSQEKLFIEYLNDSPEISIVIGDASSIVDRNIERAIQMMSLKEKAAVTINIPPLPETENHSVAITFDVTLNNYKVYKPIWEWSEQEKYETALKHKETGTKLFRAGRHIDAFFKFSKACKLLITLEPMDQREELEEELAKKINTLRVLTYNNMAECHLHQKNYNHVIALCTKVLSRDADNVKALYRRGTAHGLERNWEKAFDDMKRVTELEPNNSVAKEKLQFYSEKIKKANQKMDNVMKKMFLAISDE